MGSHSEGIPHWPKENQARLKKHHRRVMAINKCPEAFRDFGWLYILEIQHFLAREASNDHPPKELITSSLVDISEYMDFSNLIHRFPPKWHKSNSKMTAKMIPKWPQHDTHMAPKWTRTVFKIMPKLFRNDAKHMMPKLFQHDPTW